MTEIEKIAYAKSFIDKLANGINPLDDTAIPEGDLINNVRISRCLFYVSGLLRQMMISTKPPRRVPFLLTSEEILKFEYTDTPISVSAMARKINFLAGDLAEKHMERFSYRKISQWLLNLGLVEWREWEDGRVRLFPTEEGEAMGLEWIVWSKYGRRSPVIVCSEEVQRFIMDNFAAVLATEVPKKTRSPKADGDDEEHADEG